jgi:cation diffusion facilitator CzcD-associated flavoprotein CzcO
MTQPEQSEPANGSPLRSRAQCSGTPEKGSERSPFVVVASGRFNKPLVPPLPGLESFACPRGVLHSFEYKDPESFRGKRVLAVDCAITALEIASDFAMFGGLCTFSTFCRQRYVVQKLVAGVPNDALAFTRFAALNAEVTPTRILGKAVQGDIPRFGSPERFGAFSLDAISKVWSWKSFSSAIKLFYPETARLTSRGERP